MVFRMDMYEHEAIDLFRATFETLSPRWQLSHDSNALELSPITGPVAAAVKLSSEQATQIRALAGVTSSVTVDALLFEKKFRLHLSDEKSIEPGGPERPLRALMLKLSRVIWRADCHLQRRSCRKSIHWL